MLLKRFLQQYQERQARLREAREECDRLRAELSHLEHESYEIWASDLPRSRKRLWSGGFESAAARPKTVRGT